MEKITVICIYSSQKRCTIFDAFLTVRIYQYYNIIPVFRKASYGLRHLINSRLHMPQNTNQEHNQENKSAISIAQKWLDASALTATNKQFEEHFNLISKKVRVTGVYGYDSISYDDWARQCEQEFKDKVLKSVSYEGLKMLASNETQVMFKTVETVLAHDGTRKAHGVEILLTQEDDGVWCVTQERVTTNAEAVHDGLMKSL